MELKELILNELGAGSFFGADEVAVRIHNCILGLSDRINVKSSPYNAVGDGVTDDTAAIQAAINACNAAGGGTVIIPPTTSYYKITSGLTLYSNIQLLGAHSKPEIRLISGSTSRIFDLTGLDNVAIENLTLDGQSAVSSAEFIKFSNTTNSALKRNKIKNAPGTNSGSILVQGTSNGNIFERNIFQDGNGTAIGLTGAGVYDNDIIGNKITDYTGFGIRIGDGAKEGLVAFNRTFSNGIELVGITSASNNIRVIGNHAEGSGDNGISFSGYQNVGVGNISRYNGKAGFWCWGSFNALSGNVAISNNQENAGNNWAGFGISANYGGIGSYNTLSGNVSDDDQATPTQFNNVRISGVDYADWQASTAYAAYTYVKYGLHVYYTTSAGTSGSTAPTHTSGSVSDGGVTWQYLRSFISVAACNENEVGVNALGRYKSGGLEWYDTANWVRNNLFEGQLRTYTVAQLPSAGVNRKMIYVSDGATNKRLAISDGTNWRFPDGAVVS